MIAGFGDVGPDAVLDLDELLGVSLTLGADEHVAIVGERTAYSYLMADSTRDHGLRHAHTFAPQL